MKQHRFKNEVAQARAEAVHALATAEMAAAKSRGKGYGFKLRNGRTAVIEALGVGILRAGGGGATFSPNPDGADPVWFRVSVDGKYPNGDGWYGFVNPPTKVPDGTTREVQAPGGARHRVNNFKEDPAAALRALLDDVLGAA